MKLSLFRPTPAFLFSLGAGLGALACSSGSGAPEAAGWTTEAVNCAGTGIHPANCGGPIGNPNPGPGPLPHFTPPPAFPAALACTGGTTCQFTPSFLILDQCSRAQWFTESGLTSWQGLVALCDYTESADVAAVDAWVAARDAHETTTFPAVPPAAAGTQYVYLALPSPEAFPGGCPGCNPDTGNFLVDPEGHALPCSPVYYAPNEEGGYGGGFGTPWALMGYCAESPAVAEWVATNSVPTTVLGGEGATTQLGGYPVADYGYVYLYSLGMSVAIIGGGCSKGCLGLNPAGSGDTPTTPTTLYDNTCTAPACTESTLGFVDGSGVPLPCSLVYDLNTTVNGVASTVQVAYCVDTAAVEGWPAANPATAAHSGVGWSGDPFGLEGAAAGYTYLFAWGPAASL